MFCSKNDHQTSTLSFSDVESLVIEKDSSHFELLPECQILKYRNVIDPKDGGMHFPNGYFEEKTAKVSENEIEKIATAFEQMFQNRSPENKLSHLLPGDTYDAYMRITLKGNKVVYYSNTHYIENSSIIEQEKIAPEFTQIVQVLDKHCTFPSFLCDESIF
ncbi:MAG: hypothetical protein IK093_05950 [Ruminiclostridium sp.]|nr:hypothetical protein [Ruminiclostridium sp.]